MKKYFASDNAFKIYSFLIAVLLWLIVLYGQNPEMEKTIRTVPIEYNNLDVLENNGLCVVMGKTPTVDLTLKGKRLALNKVDRHNIEAYVYFEDTKRPGQYDLNVNVRLPIDNVLITDKSIYMIRANVENLVRSDYPINIAYTNLPNNSNKLYRAKAQPDSVTLLGPESIMASIKEVVVSVDAAESQNGVAQTADYMIINNNSKDITDDINIIKELKTVNIYPEILSIKQVPVEISITGNLPDGYMIAETSVTPKAIKVAGLNEEIVSVSSINTSSIDVSDLFEDASLTMPLTLPEGIINVEGPENVTVYFNIERVINKTIEVASVSFENLPSNLKSTVEGMPVSVEISGAESIIDNPDVKASVNLNGLGVGRHFLPIDLKAIEGVEIIGEYNIWVEITD